MEVGRPYETLYEAVFRTATSRENFDVLNSDQEIVWSTEADTKVDEEDHVPGDCPPSFWWLPKRR